MPCVIMKHITTELCRTDSLPLREPRLWKPAVLYWIPTTDLVNNHFNYSISSGKSNPARVRPLIGFFRTYRFHSRTLMYSPSCLLSVIMDVSCCPQCICTSVALRETAVACASRRRGSSSVAGAVWRAAAPYSTTVPWSTHTPTAG